MNINLLWDILEVGYDFLPLQKHLQGSREGQGEFAEISDDF